MTAVPTAIRETSVERPSARPRLGIALGSGAARGWAHIGVLKALNEVGLAPVAVAGTSIGAVVGGCFAAGKLDCLEGFARGVTRSRMLGYLDPSFSGSGLFGGAKLCRAFDRHLKDLTIEGLPCRFAAVATEYGTGSEVWLRRGRLVTAMQASYALPGIFRPVHAGGRWLMDGALVNPIPVSACRALGAELVVAVNLHADYAAHGTAVVEDGDAGGPGCAEAAAPRLARLVREAVNVAQERLAQGRLACDPPDLIIAPSLAPISLIDFHRADAAIAAGYAAARAALGAIEHGLSGERRRQSASVAAHRPSPPARRDLASLAA